MRTNIILDDDLVAKAMKLTGDRTKTAVIHRGLHLVVEREQLKELRTARGTLHWQGNLAAMRERTGKYGRTSRRHKRAD